MFSHLAFLGLIFSLLILCPVTHAQNTNGLNPSAIFSHNMALQRRMPVPVWGWAPAGSIVTVRFNGRIKTGAADAQGNWRVNLDAMEADGFPHELTMECDGGAPGWPRSVTCTNVVVGEVWFCSGQSNMEHLLGWTDQDMGAVSNRDAEIAAARYPPIRQFNQYRQPSNVPEKETTGRWLVCTPANAPGFAAIPYFFGRKLHLELNVPVGLIVGAYGGSAIESWLSREALNSDPELAARGGSALFNAMINPVIPYAIRGFLWAQGEANCGNGVRYRKEIKALIRDVRSKWEMPDLSFYVAQLAYKPGYGGMGWPLVQEAQLLALELPHTGLAVTLDAGDPIQIHYPNKQVPGLRLALWALAKDYGRALVYSGPLYDHMSVEGHAIRIFFRELGGGLKVGGGGPLNGFSIAGNDGEFQTATAVLDGDTVVVSSPGVPAPTAVRYAFMEDPRGCNLYNRANTNASGNAICPDPVELPAAPFRTDEQAQ